jgi:hypothetical protein
MGSLETKGAAGCSKQHTLLSISRVALSHAEQHSTKNCGPSYRHCIRQIPVVEICSMAYAGKPRHAGRIANLARARAERIEARSVDTDAFVILQNIEHYRNLLDSGQLDDTQRRLIKTLLSEDGATLAKGR